MRLVSVVISTRSCRVDADADLLQHVVDLVRGGPHLDHRVDQAGGPHQLLDHLAGVGFS
jgi:hypothetical protein